MTSPTSMPISMTRTSHAAECWSRQLDEELVVLVSGGPDAAADCATRIELAGLSRDGAPAGGVVVGISGSTTYSDIAAAHRQALQANAFGRRTGRAVTAFGEIAMPGITAMLGPDEARAFAESLLAPLIDHDLAGRGDLVNSLRAWLSHHGQWDPSAAALGVHRHTLRHRITTVGAVARPGPGLAGHPQRTVAGAGNHRARSAGRSRPRDVQSSRRRFAERRRAGGRRPPTGRRRDRARR